VNPGPPPGPSHIVVRGAREHNLAGVDVEIPRNRLVVVTGLSGSGKSSLAFDTLYAEGQRRYVESLSTYARTFLDQMRRPDVDSIEGLSPSIAIEQRTLGRNPRSTVGTTTEIYDYLRLLFARVGTPHCPQCGRAISSQSVEQMSERVLGLPEGTHIQILAPLVRDRKGSYRKELEDLRRKGFVRARIDGELVDLSDDIRLAKARRHSIDVVVDRIAVKNALEARIAGSLETSLRLANGVVRIEVGPGGESWILSERSACAECGISYPEISPRIFSFNSPQGACPACDGLGTVALDAPEEGRSDGRSGVSCPECGGTRLRNEARSIRIAGASIDEIARLPIDEASRFIEGLELPASQQLVADRIVREIHERMGFLEDVGLSYLTLDRGSATLSGGEGQRIRLATQVGARLMGVVYILDEPSIGLHPRDNERLLVCLERLRDLGNSVLVVEHDEETIRRADFVVDMGPGAGIHGGHIVAKGSPDEILADPASLTGAYLSGRRAIAVPAHRRPASDRALVLQGCREHNLKNVTARFPLGLFCVVTGVSGSGKSTLVNDTLYRALAGSLHGARQPAGAFDRLEGIEHLDQVIDVSQGPIGRTPRSNPATYTGILDGIRLLFSQLPEARARGYSRGRFSFNVKGGRCESCQGDGLVRIEMHFLPDLFVTCEICGGRRYNRETLEIRYKGQSIADVLEMTVEEALAFMENVPPVRRTLQTLHDVGLDYLRLGQPATTLSGGEAQRVKLARELSRRSEGRSLYLLDEPTTGLHLADVEKLLEVLNRLVENGNTVVVIEHHPDVIKTADHVIDLGPEGGAGGGEIVVAGTPEDLIGCARSHTGRALASTLSG
jgi:excinuclease ABC subunit A